ncbi:MAG: hypothetical protein NT140_01365 [Deltaproteobacteria bacterium]|nr:hypothetical protein [Deltaproteobacteria bacterium]
MNISDDAKNLLRFMCEHGGAISSSDIGIWSWPGETKWRECNNHREKAKNDDVIDELKKNKFIKSKKLARERLTKFEREMGMTGDSGKGYEITSTGYDYNDEINK